MTESEPRVGRYAADAEYAMLPEPVPIAQMVIEQPTTVDVPITHSFDVDGGDGGD